MKKILNHKITRSILTLLMVLAVTLAIVPHSGSANPGSGLAGGDWVYPDSVISATPTTAKIYGVPRDHQLITDAMIFNLAEPTVICHGFHGAGEGWLPQFYTYQNYWWRTAKGETYLSDDPKTGETLACIKATASGTYALFAYYPSDQNEAEVSPTRVQNVVSKDDAWSSGTPVEVNLLFTPAPDWLQIFSGGVKIGRDKWVYLCHPFTRGAQGWDGDIWQLSDGKWSKITSEEVRLGGSEDVLNVCAWVGQGTYALFGVLE